MNVGLSELEVSIPGVEVDRSEAPIMRRVRFGASGFCAAGVLAPAAVCAEAMDDVASRTVARMSARTVYLLRRAGAVVFQLNHANNRRIKMHDCCQTSAQP
jgi:hypothetical protein